MLRKLFSKKPRTSRVNILVDELGVVGAGRSAQEVFWTVRLGLLAYIDEVGRLHAGAKKLVWTISQQELDQGAHHLFEPLTAYHIEVVEQSDHLEFVRLLDTAVLDERLQKILIAYQKPVVYDDAHAGRLTLNKAFNWYEGQVSWAGKAINLFVHSQDGQLSSKTSENLHQLLESADVWDQEARYQASLALLDLAEHWAQEGDEPLSQTSFANRLSAYSLIIEVDGSWTLECDDDDVFAGHHVQIDFDQNFHFLEASI